MSTQNVVVMVKRLRWLHTFIILLSPSSEECSEYKWHVRPTPKVTLYARTPGTNRNHLPRIQKPEEATGMLKAGAMRDKAHPLTLNLPPDNSAMNAVLNPMTTITPMAASASMPHCTYVCTACCLSGNGIVFEDPSENLAMTVQLPNASVCCDEATGKWRSSSVDRFRGRGSGVSRYDCAGPGQFLNAKAAPFQISCDPDPGEGVLILSL